MNTIIAIAAIVTIWALVATIAWGIVARSAEDACVCNSDYEDFNDLACKDCD